MRAKIERTWIARIATPTAVAIAIVSGAAPRAQQQTPTFRSTTDLITTEVRVTDRIGQVRARPPARRVRAPRRRRASEDHGVRPSDRRPHHQRHGPESGPVGEGLILPPQRAARDISGRIFIIFIDDMHLQALDSPQVKSILGLIRDTIIHDNDLVGLVSTGYSSIEVNPTYDYQHRRFNEAINKIMGSGMTPQEIITANQTAEGPAGIRHNTHVAFQTAYDLLDQLAKITNRRKAFIYVSNGYDFNPFKNARYKYEQDKYARADKDNPVAVGEPAGGRRRRQRELLRQPVREERAAVRRDRPDFAGGRADARRPPRERDVLCRRPARPRCRAEHRLQPLDGGVARRTSTIR